MQTAREVQVVAYGERPDFASETRGHAAPPDGLRARRRAPASVNREQRVEIHT